MQLLITAPRKRYVPRRYVSEDKSFVNLMSISFVRRGSAAVVRLSVSQWPTVQLSLTCIRFSLLYIRHFSSSEYTECLTKL